MTRFLASVALFFVGAVALAANFTVTNTNDGDAGSLRDAIIRGLVTTVGESVVEAAPLIDSIVPLTSSFYRGKRVARDQGRLAAFVSADVAGYFRLLCDDDSRTLVALKPHRRSEGGCNS